MPHKHTQLRIINKKFLFSMNCTVYNNIHLTHHYINIRHLFHHEIYFFLLYYFYTVNYVCICVIYVCIFLTEVIHIETFNKYVIVMVFNNMYNKCKIKKKAHTNTNKS